MGTRGPATVHAPPRGGEGLKIAVGDKVWVPGYANSRRVRAVDGKYVFVAGIGWGLKSAVALASRSSRKGRRRA